jgi:putative spermidine/putrescine transport system permease protein
MVIPMVAVGLYSVATRWTAQVLPDGYTLDWWAATLADTRAVSSYVTSLVLAVLTALLTVAFVVPATYWARTRNHRIGSLLETIAAIPFALPFLVIAFALHYFAGLAFPSLQGTFLILLAAYVSVTFPFVYWAVDGAMAAVDVAALSQAAETCGASAWTTLRRVIVPNIGPGIAAGAMVAFATGLGEFTIVQILASSVRTMPIWAAERLRDSSPGAGSSSELAVVTTVTFVLLLLVSIAVAYLNRETAAKTMRVAPLGDPA